MEHYLTWGILLLAGAAHAVKPTAPGVYDWVCTDNAGVVTCAWQVQTRFLPNLTLSEAQQIGVSILVVVAVAWGVRVLYDLIRDM